MSDARKARKGRRTLKPPHAATMFNNVKGNLLFEAVTGLKLSCLIKFSFGGTVKLSILLALLPSNLSEFVIISTAFFSTLSTSFEGGGSRVTSNYKRVDEIKEIRYQRKKL